MGSFCISCGVSGQVIADDDKCLVIPIIQQSTFRPIEMTFADKSYSLYGVANSTCHPGAHWAPKGGFVSGTYADYGRIDPDDTPTNRRTMAEFFVELLRYAPVVAQGENTSHDVPFDLKEFINAEAPLFAERVRTLSFYSKVALDGVEFDELVTIWDYVWERATEHRLFCRDNSGGIRPLQFAAFHRVTFDHLVRFANGLKGWNNQSYELGSVLKGLLAELAEVSKDVSDDKKVFLRMHVRDGLRLNVTDSSHQVLSPFTNEHFSLLDRHLDEGLSFDDYVEAMRPSMAGMYALKAMDYLNMKFGPIVYAGQDYDNSQGKAIAKFIGAVSKEITKERKKRYEE